MSRKTEKDKYIPTVADLRRFGCAREVTEVRSTSATPLVTVILGELGSAMVRRSNFSFALEVGVLL